MLSAKEFNDGLGTHVIGFSKHWNEDRLDAGLPPLPCPVEPYPIEALIREAEALGLNQTSLAPGAKLYRGVSIGLPSIVGLSESTYTIHRITCFTPYMSYALHFGAEVICVELGSTDNVFADLTNKREPKGYQIGEVTVEVQLKPGTYKRCKIDPNIQRRVAECIAKREARQTACSFALREATSKKLMLSNEIARIDQDLKRMCDDADIAYESEAQEISRIEKELEDD